MNIKVDNCRSIQLGRFWHSTETEVLKIHYFSPIKPILCKVLEQCFDSCSHYSRHRNCMLIEGSDGVIFSFYLQQ